MDIIKEYDIRYKKIAKVNDDYVVYLPKSRLCLKHVAAKEWEIMASSAIIDYAISNGFRSLMSIKKTSGGRPYMKDKSGGIYILTEGEESGRMRLTSRKSILTMAGMLAHFHNCTEGFVQPPGIKVKVSWGKRAEKYRTITSKFEKYIYGLRHKEELTPFEEYTLNLTDDLLLRAKGCLKILRSLNYLKALEGSMKKKEVCINSASSCTAAIRNGRPVITKVFDMGYNMCIEDLALLIKNTIEQTGDKSLYEDIIKRYSEIRNLDEGMEEIIKAYVSFPYRSLKTIKKYMDKPNYSEVFIEEFKSIYSAEQMTNLLEV